MNPKRPKIRMMLHEDDRLECIPAPPIVCFDHLHNPCLSCNEYMRTIMHIEMTFTRCDFHVAKDAVAVQRSSPLFILSTATTTVVVVTLAALFYAVQLSISRRQPPTKALLCSTWTETGLGSTHFPPASRPHSRCLLAHPLPPLEHPSPPWLRPSPPSRPCPRFMPDPRHLG